MTLATVHTRACVGIEAPIVTVEVHISPGLPGFSLVGLAEVSVKEARDRVRSALLNSGFTFPNRRITVNLAPADLRKEGGRFDLAMALGILAASKQIPNSQLANLEFLGELSLSGSLRPVAGAIPASLAATKANRALILPEGNGAEVALVENGSHLVAPNLLAICSHLHGQAQLAAAPQLEPIVPQDLLDIQDVIGQQQGKRALEIAASGGHHLLLIGPPGTGKTMLASRLNGLLPLLTRQEALESTSISSLSRNGAGAQHWLQRPFRAPHHTASPAALVGGGTVPSPGEISLAHNGVLFLDELPEFERRALDALRQPLESGMITLSRSNSKVSFPAKFQLVAAMNPSPSGSYQGRNAIFGPQQTIRYLSRISGPLLDRFDLSVDIPLLPPGSLSQAEDSRDMGESSQAVRSRVAAVRKIQEERNGKVNAHLTGREIEKICRLQQNDAQFLENALLKLELSVRCWHKILKVARTIADIEGSKQISRPNLAEALSYRAIERLLRRLMR